MGNKDDQLIRIDPDTMGGTPLFAGTRVPVTFFFDYLESGETVDEFLFNFPTVSKSQAVRLLEIAKKLILQPKLDENIAG